MPAHISIGRQSFQKFRESGSFYVDKTAFISQWWEADDDVTLITRPRRFGKTLNMSMLECFFSLKYAEKAALFEGLSIWESEAYRALQGTMPVIALSFAGVKADHLKGAKDGIIRALAEAFEEHRYLTAGTDLTEREKASYHALWEYTLDPSPEKSISEQFVTSSLKQLCIYLERYHHKKPLILLDEYDTPLQEAYVHGYWSELLSFVRELFNLSFKENTSLGRALLTGITRVSKASLFSDLNNLAVVTITTNQYTDCFGFTEQEVKNALAERGRANEMEQVRRWYDGFCFGLRQDIYNPWSITNYLASGRLAAWWADTSSNALLSDLLRRGTPELKMQIETLLEEHSIQVPLDEQVVFEQLGTVQGAIWSLMLSSGYVKPVEAVFCADNGEMIYTLRLTNYETLLMFRRMITNWFPEHLTSYGNFKLALLQGDVRHMNRYLNDVAQVMFSSFDSGSHPSDHSQPERFYHGFVLGLIVDLSSQYHIRSNRESGFGRYDVILEPKQQGGTGIILEFKVHDPEKEADLEATANEALRQIRERCYDTELIARGIALERIWHFGFAFEGKHVLIVKE